jgi:predicted GIY-YIG superfamily endonuclease
MQPFCVYVLSCADGALYIGHTDDLERRIAEHQSGEIPGFTARKRRRPVTLAFVQEFATRDEAFAAERQLKGWSRAKKLAFIARDWDRLHELARCRGLLFSRPSTPGPLRGPSAQGERGLEPPHELVG